MMMMLLLWPFACGELLEVSARADDPFLPVPEGVAEVVDAVLPQAAASAFDALRSAEMPAGVESALGALRGTPYGAQLAEQLTAVVSVWPRLASSFSELLQAAPVQQVHSVYTIGQLAKTMYTRDTETQRVLGLVMDESTAVVQAMVATRKVFRKVATTCSRHWTGIAANAKGVLSGLETAAGVVREGAAAVNWVPGAGRPEAAPEPVVPAASPEPEAPAASPASPASPEPEAAASPVSPEPEEAAASPASPAAFAEGSAPESEECAALRAAAVQSYQAVHQSMESYKPFWAWDGEDSLEDFGTGANLFFERHSWRAACCPNSCCTCARQRAGGAVASEPPSDEELEAALLADEVVPKDRYGELDDAESVWSAVERRVDAADEALASFAAQCGGSLARLFDHTPAERGAARLAFCVSDWDDAGVQDAAVSAWASEAILYQADAMEARWPAVSCPAIAAAAVAAVSDASSSGDLAATLVETYFAEGCGTDQDAGGVVLRCGGQGLRVGVVVGSLPADEAEHVRQRFLAGAQRLGLDEAAEAAGCWARRPGVPAPLRNGVTKLLQRAFGHFETASVHARDLAAVAAVLNLGPQNVVFPPGTLGLVTAVAWVAFRFNDLVLAKLDVKENCVQAAFAMSGMLEPSFCSVVLEQGFAGRKEVLGDAAEAMDLQAFVTAAIASSAPALKNVRACLE